MALDAAPAVAESAAATQAYLQQRLLLRQSFSGGIFVTDARGVVVADMPLSAGRMGSSFMDRPHLIGALRDGRITISPPFIGRGLKAPVMSMAAPVRNAHGEVIGALVAVLELGKPNFLDRAAQSDFGQGAGFMLLAPQTRMVVTASDKRRVLQPLAAPGVDPALDRVLQRQRDVGIWHAADGRAMVHAAREVPTAGWILVSEIPADEAFAPVHALVRNVWLAAVLVSLLSAGVGGWMVRRQLWPMLEAARALTGSAHDQQRPQPLPVRHRDEVGTLIGAINGLLDTLAQREASLRESEFRWKFAIEGAGDGLWDWNLADGTVYYSLAWKQMVGYGVDEIADKLSEWESRVHPDDHAAVQQAIRAHLDGHTPVYRSEHRVRHRDGRDLWVLDRGVVVTRGAEGQPLRMLGTHSDITARKQAEQALKQSTAHMLEAQRIARLGNWSLDMVNDRLEVSEEIYRIAGVDPADLTHTYQGFLAFVHPDDRDAVHQAFMTALQERRPHTVAHRVRRPNGEVRWVEERGTADHDADGRALRARGTVQDITERVRAEQDLSLIHI